MIKVIIFGVFLTIAFAAWAPGLLWLAPWISAGVALLVLILRSIRPKKKRKPTSYKNLDVPESEYDEFDWWQDNQGL